MLIEKTDLATIFKIENQTFENFFKDFSENYINFKSNNVILDFSDNRGIKTEDILVFEDYSAESKNNGTSFVIIVDGVDIDKIPDIIITVPTRTEAEDIIEMENIERDLGF